PNDFEIGRRHDLPSITVMDESGVITVHGPFEGLDRFEARPAVVAALREDGRIVAEKRPYVHAVGHCSRCDTVVEPRLSLQWWVNVEPLARAAGDAVRDGRTQVHPPELAKRYFDWVDNMHDWTISRQLWWGHRIPAWYDDAGKIYVGRDEAEVRAKHSLGDDIALSQDNDVLETWFSSALWPFSTMGWPDKARMDERGFERFVPSSVLVTGFDIIFFWVARMIMMTDHFTGQVPFKHVYMTGLVRDSHGQKMSKSKGNVLDPLDLIDGISADALVAKRTTGLMNPKTAPKIEKATRKEFPDGIPAFGADALRFTMAALAGPGRDIKFDLGRAEGYKNFCNKLWNATRFVLMNTDGARFEGAPQPKTDAERWILAQLAKTAADAEQHFAAYRFDLLAQSLYEFAWNDFCDWFVELAKPALNGDDTTAADSTRHTLLYVLERLLSLLHPLVPFVTEELWQQVAPRLGIDGDTIMLQPYPRAADFMVDGYASAEADVEWLKSMVSALRRVRSELNVAPSKQVTLLMAGGGDSDRERATRFDSSLRFLLRLERIDFIDDAANAPAAATAVVGDLKLLVPLDGLVDLGAERTRLDKEIKRVEVEIAKCNGKLASDTFV
ncbi:MAG: valine--tRNA ligase, partial [Lysobacter sp.]